MKRIIIIALLLMPGRLFAQTGEDYAVKEGLMRSELVCMDFQKQKAVFAELSPESCCKIWRTKMTDNIHSDKLADGEKLAMHTLLDFIVPDAFDKEQQESPASVYYKKMVENVASLLQQYYDWPPSKLFRYFYTFMTEEEIKEYNKSHQDMIR